MNILISGASTGIGRACAEHLTSAGHKIWAGVRSQKSFDELSGLANLHPVFLDVADSPSIDALLKSLKGERLDALINNAGIAVGGPIEALAMDDWRRQFEINFFGLVELTKACLPQLRQARGRVLNMSSLSGRIASPFMGPYSASKFALEAYSDSLRRELRKHGVHVCIIEPGPIQTPIWEKSVREGSDRLHQLDPAMRELYGASLDKFSRLMLKTGESAAPVSRVIHAVDHALHSSRPRTRYPVGYGVGWLTRLSNVLPDKWMDQLLRARS